MAISVKLPETIVYNDPGSGLEGKNPTWKKKSEIRKEASKTTKEKHEVNIEYEKLLLQLQNHEIIEVKNTLTNTISSVQKGLQDTYDVIFEELLLLKDKLEKDTEFIEKHAFEFDKKDLDTYRYELLLRMTTILDSLDEIYISNVIDAINHDDFAKLKIQTIPEEGFFKRLSESISAMSLADKTYKEERKLSKLDKSSRKISSIIRENKEYYNDFDKIITKILLYNLVLIRRSNETIKAVESAVKSYDLIPAYKSYSEELKDIMQKEVNALKSIRKSISQIKALIRKAENALDKAQDKKLEEVNAS